MCIHKSQKGETGAGVPHLKMCLLVLSPSNKKNEKNTNENKINNKKLGHKIPADVGKKDKGREKKIREERRRKSRRLVTTSRKQQKKFCCDN